MMTSAGRPVAMVALGALLALLLTFSVGFLVSSEGGTQSFGLLPLCLLAPVLWTLAAMARGARPVLPGQPAPLGAPVYGLASEGRPWHALPDRFQALPPAARRVHARILWSLAGISGVGVAGILGGLLLGSGDGPLAVALLLGGWLAVASGYIAGGFRAFLPSALAFSAFGVVLQGEAVALAWGWHTPWFPPGLLFLAVLALPQAFCVEAVWRSPQRRFWTLWLGAGIFLAAALPVLLLFSGPTKDLTSEVRLAIGLSAASVPWGLAALIGLAPIPARLRWMTIGVLAVASLALAAAMASPGPATQNLAAAAFAAVVAAGAICFTAFLVVRPRPTLA